MNPLLAKNKAMSAEGRKMADELEELNWKIQMCQFDLCNLNNQYVIKNAAYKEFLGYKLTEKDLEELKKCKEDLKDGSSI